MYLTENNYLFLTSDGVVNAEDYAYLTRVSVRPKGRQLEVELSRKWHAADFEDEARVNDLLRIIEAAKSSIVNSSSADHSPDALKVTGDARLVRGCEYVAGAGVELVKSRNYDLLFETSNMQVLRSFATRLSVPELTIAYTDLTELRLDGPGRTTSGGGFVGGGFGLGGAAEGIAIAGILNALTTRTNVETVMALAGPGWEAFFLHKTLTPTELRQSLSPVFVRLQSTARPPLSHTDTLAQLERVTALRNQGALTEEEFSEAKRRILGL